MTDLSISVTVLPTGDGVCSVVRLVGEADLTTPALREALTSEITASKSRLVLVDMSALSFIDSAAMQMVIAAYQVLRRDGGMLAMIRPTSTVARTLGLAGISQLIHIYDSVDDAIKSLSGNPKPQ
jgi:anti-sigma B factor antagonist